MSFPNIVIVGHVCIDHNASERTTYTGWGSPAIYMANYLQMAQQLEPTIITRYGTDLLKYLPAVHIVPARPTQADTLLYENDTRGPKRIWRCHNLAVADPPDLSAEAIEALKAADIVVVAPLLPNFSVAYVRELLGHVTAPALTMLCPQGYLRHVTAEGLVTPRNFTEAAEVVPLFDVVVYSEEDSPEAFALAKDWKQLPTASNTHIIVTEGSKGASIVETNGRTSIPTTPIDPEDIVDSVGCGDVFAITVAHALWQFGDIQKAIAAGHKAAAEKLLATAQSARATS